MSYKEHQGLLLLPSNGETLIWSIFSAPNTIYRKYFHFYYDAFTIFTIGNTLSESPLTLYNQDVREQIRFKKAARYGVLSGRSLMPAPLVGNPFNPTAQQQKSLEACRNKTELAWAERGPELSPLIIGCSLDLSKGASALGKSIKKGISLCVDYYNQQNKRPIKVIFMDDEYSPEKARQNVESFIKEYKSTLFLCNLGSPTLQAYIDLVKQGKIFLFFPITGAPIFRKPDLPTIVHWRVSYKTEAKVLTQYMIDEFKSQNFGFLYQDDSFGLGALEGSRQVLQKAGIKRFTEVSYDRNTTSFDQQFLAIKNAQIQTLGFFSTPTAATEFIRQAGVAYFIGKKLFALSDLGEDSFKKFVHQKGLDMIIAQFSPDPATSTIELVKEYRTVFKKKGYFYNDVFALEGYIAASFALDILNKTKDPSSNKAILDTITKIKDYWYKGFKLSFNPETRELAHMLWIDTGGPEWIEQNIKS